MLHAAFNMIAGSKLVLWLCAMGIVWMRCAKMLRSSSDPGLSVCCRVELATKRGAYKRLLSITTVLCALSARGPGSLRIGHDVVPCSWAQHQPRHPHV